MTDEEPPKITKLVTGKKPGRPPLIVENAETLKIIRGLSSVQCTQFEAACVLHVSEATFEQFLRHHTKAREAWDNGRGEGKASLRRTQWKMAQKSAAMAIWLGKQLLGQKDKTAIVGDRGDAPVSLEHGLEHGLNILLLEARREKQKDDK